MERSENAAARHHHHGRTVGLMSEDGKREYDSESGRAAETRMSGEHTGARSLHQLSSARSCALSEFAKDARTDGRVQAEGSGRETLLYGSLFVHACMPVAVAPVFSTVRQQRDGDQRSTRSSWVCREIN
jgi:hypothetical protein